MQISATLLVRSTTFRITLGIFLLLNIWTLVRRFVFPECCDQGYTVGFPFPYLIVETGASEFYVLGAFLDLSLALTIALIATWAALGFRNPRGD